MQSINRVDSGKIEVTELNNGHGSALPRDVGHKLGVDKTRRRRVEEWVSLNPDSDDGIASKMAEVSPGDSRSVTA